MTWGSVYRTWWYSGFLEYVTSFPHSSILDIGTGQGNAANELHQKLNSDSVSVLATDIIAYPESKRLSVPIILTSAEVMRGFPPESTTGIISTFGIPYGHVREIAHRFHELLVPGGAIQVVFPARLSNSPIEGISLPNAHEFASCLQNLGYSVHIQHISIEGDNTREVCVAIKPIEGKHTIEAAK